MRTKIDKQQIEYVQLSALTPYARNSRTHSPEQVKRIAASIREFGFTNPVLIDADGTIIAGHGRVLAAQHLQMDTVPVVRLDYMTEQQKRAYVIADNRLALDAGWDEELLRVELDTLHADGYDVAMTGFGADELAELMKLDIADKQETDEDEVPEPPAEPTCKTGDIWQLGAHRLICGDSTAKHSHADGCNTLFFDPPWDAGVAMPKMQHTLAFADGQRMHDVVQLFGAPTWLFAWDCVSSWYVPNRPLRRMKLCAWYGDVTQYNSDGAHYGEAAEAKIVTNSRGTYNYKPDPRGKHLSDVYSTPITKLHADGEHKHSKPVEWVRMLIANCTAGNIYDPFAGSGTTIIACEEIQRACVAMEISPAYCDVIIARWEKYTGLKAHKL
jgi:hypothetical protein